MSGEEQCGDRASQLDRVPLSACVFYPGTGSVRADRWKGKKGRKKKEQHSQGRTESVPVRSAPALPTKLLGCPHLSDKWPKKEGSTKLSAEPFVPPRPLFFFINSLSAPLFPDIPSLSWQSAAVCEAQPPVNELER